MATVWMAWRVWEWLSNSKEDRKMHRKVLRFAEQGWSVIYYTFSWCFGLVRLLIWLLLLLLLLTNKWLVCPYQSPYQTFRPYRSLATLSPYTPRRTCQVLLSDAGGLLPSPSANPPMLRLEEMITSKWWPTISLLSHLLVQATSPTLLVLVCILLVLMDWCDIWLPVSKTPQTVTKSNALGNHSSLRCCATLIWLTMWYYIHLVSSVVVRYTTRSLCSRRH